MKIDENYLKKITSWEVIIKLLFKGEFELVGKLLNLRKIISSRQKIIVLIDPKIVKNYNIEITDKILDDNTTFTKNIDIEKYY